MFSFMIVLLTILTTTAAAQAVSPNYGIPGKQIARSAICNPTAEATCVQLSNNTQYAIALGFSWAGGGVPNALVTEAGATQCVFVAGPGGTRCVSVLAPGEKGWVVFPTAGLVGVQVTRWTMPGIGAEQLSSIPGTSLPAVVLGDPALLLQGMGATQVARSSCDIDMRDAAQRVKSLGACR